MSYKLFKRGTLLIPSGTSFNPGKKHLFVICNDTCDDGKNLIVPIASWTNNYCDGTCELNVGDHPFIRHHSYMSYSHTRLEAAEDLFKGINDGTFSTHLDFNLHHFLRIKMGIVRSKQTKKKFKDYAYNVMRLTRF